MMLLFKGHMGTVYVMVYSKDIAFSFIEKWYESTFLKLECWFRYDQA